MTRERRKRCLWCHGKGFYHVNNQVVSCGLCKRRKGIWKK